MNVIAMMYKFEFAQVDIIDRVFEYKDGRVKADYFVTMLTDNSGKKYQSKEIACSAECAASQCYRKWAETTIVDFCTAKVLRSYGMNIEDDGDKLFKPTYADVCTFLWTLDLATREKLINRIK